MLLLGNFSLAQSRVGFSGTFLRTETMFRGRPEAASPRILDIKQTADEVIVTATQNGESAVAHYRLDGKKSGTVQAWLKGENLVLKGTVKRQGPGLGLDLGLRFPLTVAANVEEKWELSPDSQQLVIRTKQNVGAGESVFDTRYIREPSLEAAQAGGLECQEGLRDNTPDLGSQKPERKTAKVWARCRVRHGPLGTDYALRLLRCRPLWRLFQGPGADGEIRTGSVSQERPDRCRLRGRSCAGSRAPSLVLYSGNRRLGADRTPIA